MLARALMQAAVPFISKAASANSFAASEQAAEVRPPKEAFVNLTLTYLAQASALALIPLFTATLGNFIPFLGWYGLELVLYFFPVYVFATMFWAPFVLQVLYLLVGSDMFLFKWLDEAIARLIEHYISNANLIVGGFNLFLGLAMAGAAIADAPAQSGFHVLTGLLMNAAYFYFWD